MTSSAIYAATILFQKMVKYSLNLDFLNKLQYDSILFIRRKQKPLISHVTYDRNCKRDESGMG